MPNYYANISGAANIQVPFNPYQVYTGNGYYIRLELNCDNLRTDSLKANAAVWLNGTGNWFSFEMYGEGWEYFNLGYETYIGRYDYWSTNGFEETLVLEVNNGAVTLTKGQQTSATTFWGDFGNSNISFFPTTYGENTRVHFYEWKAYGTNNTLLFDFVPDYNGATKGLRDKVSGNFYAATDQTKIELIPLSTFEIAPTESAATYESGTTTITVNTDNDTSITWTASTSDSWLSLSISSGTGDGSVTVTYTENETFQNRTGTVTFTSSEGDVLTFTIEQEKKPALVYDHPIYRSGNLVKKMYRSGELIYLRLNPASEEPPVPPTPVLPSNTFLINYNSKFYNSSTYTIPKTEGQIFNEDMVLNAAASSYTSDHITVNGQQFDYVFQVNSLNPFNRSDTDSLTVIIKAKPSSLTSGAHSLFSNRGGSYNWMVFNPANGSPAGMFFLHTSDGNYNNVPSVQARNLNEPNIFAFRVSNGTGYGHSYTDNETFSTKNISWGGIANSVHFLGGLNSSEYWAGDFYWMYMSTEALTDGEIQQVIDYNETINPTNE